MLASEIVARALRHAVGSPAYLIKAHLGNFPNHTTVGVTRLRGVL